MARYFCRQLHVALLGSFLLLCITQHHQTQASKPKEYTLEKASDALSYYSEWLTTLATNATSQKDKNFYEDLIKIVEEWKEGYIISINDERVNMLKPDDMLNEAEQVKMQDLFNDLKVKVGQYKLESAPMMVALARSRKSLYDAMVKEVGRHPEQDVDAFLTDAIIKVTTLKVEEEKFTSKYKATHFGKNWYQTQADQEDVNCLKAAINAAKEAILVMLNAKPSASVDGPSDPPVRVVTPPTLPKTKVDNSIVSPAKQTPDLQRNPPALPSKPGCWDKTCGIVKNPYFYVTAPVVVITLAIGLAIYLSGNNPNLPSAAVTGTIDSAFTAVAKGFSPLLAVVIILLVVAILTGGAFYYLDMQRQAGSKKKSTRKCRKKKSKTPGKSSKLTTQSPNQDSKLMKIQSTGKSSLPMSPTSPSIALTKKTSKLKSPMVKNISKMSQFDVKTNKLAFKADSKLKSQQLDSSFWKDLGKNHSNMSQVSSKPSKQPTQVTTTRSSFAPTKAAKKLKKKSQSLVLVKKRTQSTSPSSFLTPKPTTTRRR